MTQYQDEQASPPAETQDEPKTPRYQDDGEGWIAGNLTRDPELRFTANGLALCSMRVASSIRVKNPDTGQWEDGPTSFNDVMVWRQQACNVAESLAAGDRVVAVGHWQIQTYQTSDGEERTRRVLIAKDVGAGMAHAEVRLYKRTRAGRS